MKYSDKLKNPRWQRKRLEILERDEYECQRCHSDSTLQVHHLQYHKNHDPWDYENDDLITLCDSCHNITNVNVPESEIRNPWIIYERAKYRIGILSPNEYQEKIKMIYDKLSL